MNHVETLESRLQFDGGALDTTFGDDAAVTIDYKTLLGDDGWRTAGTRFTQDTGGRIYITSKQRRFADDNFTLLEEKLVITRFSRDGQLDTEFGGGGQIG